MAFESGTIALIPCTLTGKMPKDFLERLQKYSAGKLDDVKDEPAIGWVSGRHLLESEINENTAPVRRTSLCESAQSGTEDPVAAAERDLPPRRTGLYAGERYDRGAEKRKETDQGRRH